MLQISQLFIYPIKSMAGISVKSAKVTATGFEYDRRWMLVDEHNMFISQREVPKMALIKVNIEANGLLVSLLDVEYLIPFNEESDSLERTEVTIWDDTCTAEFVGIEADQWFSNALQINCRLVYMPDDVKRIVDQKYAPADKITSFSDAYPFLLIGEESLHDLNGRLETSLQINRFRPNIVFSGGEAFDEDKFAHFTINAIDFYGLKLCARCSITTIDQENAVTGKEPLKTLAKYRQKNNKILFGQNLVHSGNGEVKIGDILNVLTYNADERFVV